MEEEIITMTTLPTSKRRSIFHFLKHVSPENVLEIIKRELKS
ncbi:hypothetical protein LEP1GSC188_3552 [Leptospira weilii serovar Topaz str. LT2116]|uniref:Uncharacterized protein n=1 Tax=Leptospira weilii serovar Topaz str. LT2116 TaxID=1088540 RepID=M3GX89_9LEPT|nr:hypothetical protein LEP1GSC188_3552 [Leptospira weilii serovar Topaz str. LT2116]